VSIASAHAELLHYDPFLIGSDPSAGEYTLGQLVGQNPIVGPAMPPFLAGPWTTGGAIPQSGHVVQAGPVGPFVGGSVKAYKSEAGEGGRAARYLASPLDDSTSGTFYLSFIVNFGASELPTDGIGFRALEFWQAGDQIGTGFPALMLGYDEFGLLGDRMAFYIEGMVGIEQVLPDAPPSFNDDGQYHFIVMKFDLDLTPAADEMSIYLNPPIYEGIPDTASASNWTDWSSVAASAVVNGLDFTLGAIGAPSWFGGTGRGPEFDEIRVGTEFADVLPPRPDFGPCSYLDEECYLTIVQHMHKSGMHTTDGDLNNDGRVDLYDLRIWRDNREDIYPLLAAVPEPAGVLLIAFSAILPLSRRRLGSCQLHLG
jgi:hypothetical protein